MAPPPRAEMSHETFCIDKKNEVDAANSTIESENSAPDNGSSVSLLATMSWDQIEERARLEADGVAPAAMVAELQSDPIRWRNVLTDMIEDAEDTLQSIRRIKGPQRNQIITDFESEFRSLTDAFERATGELYESEETDEPVDVTPDNAVTEPVALQLSWTSGKVIAWASGAFNEPESSEEVLSRLVDAGAPENAWEDYRNIVLPTGLNAPALSAQVGDILGWLAALATQPWTEQADITPLNEDAIASTDEPRAAKNAPPEPLKDDIDPDNQANINQIGASARWLSLIAAAAVGLVAQGRTVPKLQRIRKRRNKRNKNNKGEFIVQWMPGIISKRRLEAFANSLPGAVTAADPGPDARAVVQSALTGMVNAIVANAAGRLEVPAPPPDPKTKSEVAETFLANLSGRPFSAAADNGSDLARKLEQWARPVTAVAKYALIVQLDEPDDSDAWQLKVLSPGPENSMDPVEVAMVSGSNTRRTEVKGQYTRLERMVPALKRPGGRRQGEVLLDQDEAWELMSSTGPALESAGFDVRVPALSRRRQVAQLRLTADDADSIVGAQQLTAVSWSAVFGEVELTAAEIQQLAMQKKPLVQSRGRWVALEQADLVEAAAALAERADTTELTGAQMLRHALGLEGSGISGGVTLGGNSWASDLLRAASSVNSDPEVQPEGFTGELRSYQAEAVGWLQFLDDAGLGGCLALDMGLGKTPTILARIGAKPGPTPALVVAPPAVVGNWAAEAKRFTPNIKTLVHHGPSRAGGADLKSEIRSADLVITTYGTAVRDIEALSSLQWDRVVLDEAQVIKNHRSATAKELRKLQARSRLALTGTPIENGLGDLWAIMDFCNPGLVGGRTSFIDQLNQIGDAQGAAESALHTLNGVLVFRRTKAEPLIAAELPDRIDELAQCTMTPEQIGLYQAVLDKLVRDTAESEHNTSQQKGLVLAAITALKQICNHPLNYDKEPDNLELEGRSGKLTRLDEIIDAVFAAEERILIFTHFATWGERLAKYLTERTGIDIECYHGGLARGTRDRLVDSFQSGEGAGAMVLSLKAGGTGLNLTAASHVVLYDRWWNPAVEDQARDRVWRIGQTKTVICHRLVCPGTVDERVEEVVQGKRRIADMVLPKSSSLGDLDAEQLRSALGLDQEALLAADPDDIFEDATGGVKQ
ncbi:MAG: DEAD/DEAH box helicase [Candidatus Poriferisodalaceae bacterium]